MSLYYFDEEGVKYKEFNEDEDTINKTFTYYKKVTEYIYKNAERKEEYRNQSLYKIATLPIIATTEVIKNSLIEKFKYQEIIVFKEATEADKESGKTLYYWGQTEEGAGYIELIGPTQENVTYFI